MEEPPQPRVSATSSPSIGYGFMPASRSSCRWRKRCCVCWLRGTCGCSSARTCCISRKRTSSPSLSVRCSSRERRADKFGRKPSATPAATATFTSASVGSHAKKRGTQRGENFKLKRYRRRNCKKRSNTPKDREAKRFHAEAPTRSAAANT